MRCYFLGFLGDGLGLGDFFVSCCFSLAILAVVYSLLFGTSCTFECDGAHRRRRQQSSHTPNVQNETATNQLRSMLALKQPGLIAQEASHCSARTSAKETHLILELRLHSAAGLLPFFPWIKLCLCAMGGELLGPKPAPGWSRKLRGQQWPPEDSI